MEPDKIIEAFTQVVREQDYVFSDAAIADIPTLQNKLAAIENPTLEAIAEVLRQWYIHHKSVRNAILLQERKFSRFPKKEPQDDEDKIPNTYRIVREDLEKLYERKQSEKLDDTKKADNEPK